MVGGFGQTVFQPAQRVLLKQVIVFPVEPASTLVRLFLNKTDFLFTAPANPGFNEVIDLDNFSTAGTGNEFFYLRDLNLDVHSIAIELTDLTFARTYVHLIFHPYHQDFL